MGLSLGTKNLKQYRDVVWLLVKYGRSDLVRQAGLGDLVEDEALQSPELPRDAVSLADDLESMGPTFVKLGQLLSTRSDLMPDAYLDALARLQDKVEPFSFQEVEKIVASELGVRLSKAFSEFESEPMAAASLGQVHRARLRDGRQVAVKVQRPGIREKMTDDLEALMEVAGFLDKHTETGRKYEFAAMIEELRRSLIRELDYYEEARNLQILRRNLQEFDLIIVPQPIDDYTTPRVLTMEYVAGRKVTDVSPLRRIELDGYKLLDQLFQAYLKQILVDGFVHADPHPGNVLLTDDDRVALLDLGMVARVTPSLQDQLLKFILAVSEGRADAAARITLGLCEAREGADRARFHREVTQLIAQHHDTELHQIETGRVLLDVKGIAAECGYSLPPEMTMIGKTLLNLDRIGQVLASDFDPNESVRRHASRLMQQKFRASFTSGNIFSGLLEAKEALEQLPPRVNLILERLANNDVEIKVDAIDERTLIEGMQKIANRITMGLILGALIVGAAMLMDVPTTFRIGGYPGLAIIFFLLAGGGGLILVFNILLNDLRANKN